jgi:hypothetical protein
VCVDARQYLAAALVYMYIYTGDAFQRPKHHNQLIDLARFWSSREGALAGVASDSTWESSNASALGVSQSYSRKIYTWVRTKPTLFARPAEPLGPL